MITQEDLKLLVNAAYIAGFNVDPKKLILETWQKGIETHKPAKLPHGYFAVYIFEHRNSTLKVGKVSGSKNNDRYYQHHYIVKGANSTLARSIAEDKTTYNALNEFNVRSWIICNTNRYNILIPIEYGKNFVNFAEAFFILKLEPKFEGKILK